MHLDRFSQIEHCYVDQCLTVQKIRISIEKIEIGFCQKGNFIQENGNGKWVFAHFMYNSKYFT